ncbi:uncharacterized protein DS421_13g403150 [Arachis hypogaea]|nr:uncharacterized protein DS421_13g403150 [Arachis hypogaea]
MLRAKGTRILKARVELCRDRILRDIFTIVGPKQNFMEIGLRYERVGKFCVYCVKIGHELKRCNNFIEDSAQNCVKENKIGEWTRTDQVGRRIKDKEEPGFATLTIAGTSFLQQKKKPTPDWLLEDFSKLKVADMKDKENQATEKAPGILADNIRGREIDGLMSVANMGEAIILQDITYQQNMENLALDSYSKFPKTNKNLELKKLARHKDQSRNQNLGGKRKIDGNENEDSLKRICSRINMQKG